MTSRATSTEPPLIAYVEQDNATGIWTVDIPELWVIGHQSRARTAEQAAREASGDPRARIEVRTFDGWERL